MRFDIGYWSETAAMWNSFRKTAQALVPTDETARAIDAAQFTFRLFIDWLKLA
jgi:heme oxygenase